MASSYFQFFWCVWLFFEHSSHNATNFSKNITCWVSVKSNRINANPFSIIFNYKKSLNRQKNIFKTIICEWRTVHKLIQNNTLLSTEIKDLISTKNYFLLLLQRVNYFKFLFWWEKRGRWFLSQARGKNSTNTNYNGLKKL